MSESKLSRLYNEEPVSGFPGSVLKEGNFNEIINSILCLNLPSQNTYSGVMDFGNGMTFEVTQKDKYGNALAVRLTSRYKTDKTPFFNDGSGLYFKNKEIKYVDETSNFIALTPNGTIISKDLITLSSNGLLRNEGFSPSPNYILLDNLTVIKDYFITINRNSDTSISGYSVSYQN